ncbi:MAG TPA: hypothetical protein VGN16_15475 [Acidobacteriaceae bacterium]|jgi:hypothetical protein
MCNSFFLRFACVVLLSGSALAAQVATAPPGPATTAAKVNRRRPRHEVDLSLTYDAFRQNGTPGPSFWQSGGSVDLNAQIHRGLGAEVLFTAATAKNANNSGVDVNTMNVVFGPRYTFTYNKKAAVFGDVLFGETHGFHGVYPSTSGATSSANSFALMAGGGMDVRLAPHVAIRLVEVRWLRSQLPNATTNVQNGVQIGAGVTFRFGTK